MTNDVRIGLETHLQLMTKSKLFCGCPNRGVEEPNTRTCPTCLGMPGARPQVNKRAIEMGIKIAKALGCKIPKEMNFSRKTYFYPDMPKNFQTTQFSLPIGTNGQIKMELGGEEKTVRIKRVHLEEDPGKLKHVGGGITSADYVLVDYNRSGTPLCEVVTEPDLSSPNEARIFLRKLSDIFEYLKVYDSTGEGTIRSDANVSTWSERTEVKNITGFKDIEKALIYEIRRQKNLKKRGKEVIRETRTYDDSTGTTKSLRTKEKEADYGYIFDPDLTRIELHTDWIEKLAKDIPELPHEKKRRYVEEYGVSREVAVTISSDFELAKTFEKLIDDLDVERASSMLAGPVKKVLNYNDMRFKESKLTTEKIKKLLDMIDEGQVTERNAEMILRVVATENKDPERVKEDKGFGKVTENKTKEIVERVLEENKDAAEDYIKGKDEALNHLVGQVMKGSGGSADPREARKLLKDMIKD